ncbi:hypothetical protein [Streptomyces sp. HNM0574]|uniref:hypothetical protein n=1 Tax=Streptomyces sp. HNM0574 TaxID=2714954 RepID=UPI00146AACD7|nr:hypothetical protein [Streptomyces sp. HNM0574]NLU68661.1 hypothetical protein [Streptomyces sp. HNM0574]
MDRKALRLGIAGGAFALASIVSPAAQAAGLEHDYAKSGWPSGKYHYECVVDKQVVACYQPHGDKIFLMDRVKGGSTASAWFSIPGAGREGQCESRLGAETWGVCNKNFPEGKKIALKTAKNGGKGITMTT